MIIAIPDYKKQLNDDEYLVKHYCINQEELSIQEKEYLIPLDSIPPTPQNPNAVLVFNTSENKTYWTYK